VSTATKATVGKFVWRELTTTDMARAEAFYTELFGWRVEQTPMADGKTYPLLVGPTGHFGGLMQLEGVPSNWLTYVEVENVDAATERAVALGAQVIVQPRDIVDVGRFSIILDPQGAAIAPFSDATATGEDPEPQLPPVGGITWTELLTSDVDAAVRFYTEVIGWTTEKYDMGGQEYTVFKRGERLEGGVMAKPAELPASLWLINFRVADVEKARADVTRLGGQLIGSIIEVPTIGRVAWAIDPTGAVFAMHEAVEE